MSLCRPRGGRDAPRRRSCRSSTRARRRWRATGGGGQGHVPPRGARGGGGAPLRGGRGLAERLGYPGQLLDAIPAEALASFAGVGHHLDLAALEPGEAVLDLGSGSGTDVFCAAVLVGESGRVVGVDITDDQLDKAARLRDTRGLPQVQFVEAHIEELPFDDASFDAVVSNGVINLSPAKDRVFAEAARVLRPGGRLAIADIVSGRALKERTRRNVELWAACIAGAIPRSDYLEAIEAQGLHVKELRNNDYRFISERALELQHVRGPERLAGREARRQIAVSRTLTARQSGVRRLRNRRRSSGRTRKELPWSTVKTPHRSTRLRPRR